MNITFTACSNTGLVRRNNEDNLYCDGVSLTPETSEIPFLLESTAQSPCIFAVCDGMGGESDGELASLTAVSTLNEYADSIKSAVLSKSLDSAVNDFIHDSNNRLCNIMKARSSSMGTTLALAVVTGSRVHAYNLGDSRIYTLKDNIFSLISEDQTMAAQKVKMGILTPEQALRDRSRNVLMRYLGVFESEMVLEAGIITPFEINTQCRMLLCSDGITDMINDSQIEAVLRNAPDTSNAAKTLINNAMANGGRDNATCIVIEIK